MTLIDAALQTFVAQSKRDLDILNQHINDTPIGGKKLRVATWWKPCDNDSFAPPPMSREQVDFVVPSYQSPPHRPVDG